MHFRLCRNSQPGPKSSLTEVHGVASVMNLNRYLLNEARSASTCSTIGLGPLNRVIAPDQMTAPACPLAVTSILHFRYRKKSSFSYSSTGATFPTRCFQRTPVHLRLGIHFLQSTGTDSLSPYSRASKYCFSSSWGSPFSEELPFTPLLLGFGISGQ